MDIQKINRMTAQDLEKSGIPKKRAEEIIRMRDERGGFKSEEDLKQIPEMMQMMGSEGGEGDGGKEK
jgi:competence ComEA-like helix-hairpin-helix protein